MLFVWGENRWRPQVPDKWPGITVNRGIVCRGSDGRVSDTDRCRRAREVTNRESSPHRDLLRSVLEIRVLKHLYLHVQVSIFAKYET